MHVCVYIHGPHASVPKQTDFKLTWIVRVTTPERGFVFETLLNSAADHTLRSQIGFPRDDPEVLGIWHPDVGIVFFFNLKEGGKKEGADENLSKEKA